MSNSYFQFKQFTINQDKAAMKVCTDACLFGAWVAARIESQNLQVKNVLDVGSGTGLLSLMIAQKSTAKIDAVELDASAATQTEENFEASTFARQLRLIETDIRSFTPGYRYDLIISNPPFFSNDLKSENTARNLALHSQSLSFQELINSCESLLKEDGVLAVLLPFHRWEFFLEEAQKKQLFLQEQVLVKQTERHPYFRSMLRFGKVKKEPKKLELVIKVEGQYSTDFASLLADYYLYL